MRLGTLIEGLGVILEPKGLESLRVCDITEDSRTAMPGSLFVARPGLKSDGRAFIDAAIRSGAVAVLTDRAFAPPRPLRGPDGPVALLRCDDVPLVSAHIAERFHASPSSRLFLAGVTGTNGKSTTAHLIYRLLGAAGVRCGLIGSVAIDDGSGPAPATMTTPPAAEISQTLAAMLEHACRACAMEVSSHALDQKRVAALTFDAAVYTNLTGDHLDYHKNMEAYAAAKARLFDMVGDDAVRVVNIDDPNWRLVVRNADHPKTLTCSLGAHPDAHCTAEVHEADIDGVRATYRGPWGSVTADIPLIGRYNVMNCLQALAVAHAAGVEPRRLQRALTLVDAPAGRLQRISTGEPDESAVFVDYAHTDDALRNVIGALRPVVPLGGQLRVVFGCGGDRDATKRPRMGRAVAELADLVTVTSDNPRTEKPHEIISAILDGIPPDRRDAVRVDADRAEAIRTAIADAGPRDVVLIAGKGHETYQILPDGSGGTTTIPFDDAEHARRALRERTNARRTAETRAT